MATVSKQKASSTARQAPSKSARRRAAKAGRKRWEIEVGATSVPGFGTNEGFRITDRTVGLAEYSTQQQVKMPRMLSRDGGRLGSIDELRGSEFLGSISTGDESPQAGDLLSRILINPSVFTSTRLQQFAALYQRYRFKRAAIRYQADANSTQSGSVIGFMDYDVDNLLTLDDPLNVKKAAAHFAQQPNKIWQSQDYFLGVLDKFTTLFINTEEGTENRLVYQGVWYLIAATELPPNSALGTIYFDYEIEFSIPALENIPEDFYSVLALEGNSAPITPTQPFGNTSVDEFIAEGYPISNIDYTFAPGAPNVLTIHNIRPGNYELVSQVNAVGTGMNGNLTLNTSWNIVSGNALWTSGLNLQTQTNVQETIATTASGNPLRNNFRGVFIVTEYQTDIIFQPSLAIASTGISYAADTFQLILKRLPEPQVIPAVFSKRPSRGGGREAKLLTNYGPSGSACLFLNPKKKSTRILKEKPLKTQVKSGSNELETHDLFRRLEEAKALLRAVIDYTPSGVETTACRSDASPSVLEKSDCIPDGCQEGICLGCLSLPQDGKGKSRLCR